MMILCFILSYIKLIHSYFRYLYSFARVLSHLFFTTAPASRNSIMKFLVLYFEWEYQVGNKTIKSTFQVHLPFRSQLICNSPWPLFMTIKKSNLLCYHVQSGSCSERITRWFQIFNQLFDERVDNELHIITSHLQLLNVVKNVTSAHHRRQRSFLEKKSSLVYKLTYIACII